MACNTHCCVLTRGEFFVSDWKSDCSDGIVGVNCSGLPNPFKKVGNVSSSLVNINSSIIGVENKYNPMKDACSRVLIESIDLTITFSCASKSNLYRALFSDVDADVTNVNTRDFCIFSLNECDFFPFNKYGVDEESLQVILRDSNGDPVKTLVVEEDYIITKSGVEILREIDIENAVILRLYYEYDPTNYYLFDFASKYMGYKTIYFKGTNFNDESNDLFDCVFHKVLFTPINSFDLISRDEFFTLTLSGRVELDKDQNSWFKLIKEES